MRRLRPAVVAVALALAALGAGSSAGPASAGEQPLAANFTRTIVLTGDGSGRAYSVDDNDVADGRIDCEIVRGAITGDSVCSYTSADFNFVYYVNPVPGNQACDFLDCWTSPSLFSWQAVASETRTYQLLPLSYQLTVKRSGSGSGSIVGTPSVINCGEICGASLEYGTTILLTALPDNGSTFTRWRGACAGQPADCHISIIADTNTTAVFAPTPTPSPPKPTATPPPTPGPTASPSPSAAPTASATPTSSPTVIPVETPSPTASVAQPAVTPPPSPSQQPAASTVAADQPPVLLIVLGGLAAGALVGAIGIGVVLMGIRQRRRRR